MCCPSSVEDSVAMLLLAEAAELQLVYVVVAAAAAATGRTTMDLDAGSVAVAGPDEVPTQEPMLMKKASISPLEYFQSVKIRYRHQQCHRRECFLIHHARQTTLRRSCWSWRYWYHSS